MSSPGTAARLSLLGVAWPLFVEQLLRILILNVDTFMVSHVSDGAVAALGVAQQVLVLSIILFNFIGIGSSVVITHHLGGRDRAGADRIAAAAIGVNTWIGILVSAAVAGLAPLILRAQHLPPELFVYARPFLTILGGTLFLDAQNVAMAAVLRAHGRTRDAMVVTGSQNPSTRPETACSCSAFSVRRGWASPGWPSPARSPGWRGSWPCGSWSGGAPASGSAGATT